MATAAGALRTKVFTATWPSFATDASAYDGARVGRRGGAGRQHNAPRCQVEIRTVPTGSTEEALVSGGASSGWLEGGVSPEDEGVDGEGGSDNVVFLDPSLHLRRYNSVSLAEDGVYRLTLSDCHGLVVTAPPVAPAAIGSGGEHLNAGGEAYGVETARLLFLSLPLSLDFEINSQVSSGGGLEIGSFQLVPVAYMPPPPPPPPPPRQDLVVSPSSNVDTAGHAAGDGGIISTHPISVETLQSRAGENGGRTGFNGRFVSGVVVGAVATVSMAWLMVARGWGRSTRERFMSGRREDGRKKERDLSVTGADDGGGSDAGSSDSDAILRGHVPDPVGLPRSDEDWRALFDTLYEDEKD